MSDKDVYNAVKTFGNVESGSTSASSPSTDISSLLKGMMDGRQEAIADKKVDQKEASSVDSSGTTKAVKSKKKVNVRKPLKKKKARKKNVSLGGKVRGSTKNIKVGGKVGAKAATKVAGKAGIKAGGRALAGAGGKALLGAGGKALLGAAGGPVGAALAVAELAKEVAADNERRVNENMAEAIADREKIQSEVSNLLQSVEQLSTEEDVARQQALARDLLERVRRPDSFVLSKLQGMGLQNQLEALSTRFGRPKLNGCASSLSK